MAVWLIDYSMVGVEINTMRDIHHTDTLTPADHWDKESLHNAQVALKDYRLYEKANYDLMA